MTEVYAASDDFVNNLLNKSDYGVTAEQLKTIPGLFDKVAFASLGTTQDVKNIITNAFANPVSFVAQDLADKVKNSFYTDWASPSSTGAYDPTIQAQQDYLKSNNVSQDVIGNILSGSTQAGLADLAQQQAKKAAFDQNSGLKADLGNFLSSDAGKLALLVGGAYAGGAFDPSTLGAGASGVGAGAGLDAATVAEGWGGAGAVGSGGSTGLLSGTAAASPFATQGSAGYGQLGSGTFGATGVPEGSQFVTQGGLAAPATVGQGGALGAGSFASNGSALAQAGLLGGATTLAGELVPATDYYAAGTAGAGTSLGAGMADVATGGLGGLTAEQLGQMGLVQGGLGLLGGVLGGNTAADASTQAAQQYAKFAQQGANMAGFRPVGTTTTFGTSNFQVDPATGQLTSAGYQLSPQLQAYQDQIMGSNRQSLTDATNLQNLGRQYIAQNPNQVASNWYNQQQALLAPSRDTESARLANQLQQTGRTGVSVAQGGNLQAANPEMAALANARAMADAQMAANAQTYGQQQVGFGQGLLTNAYQPFNAGLSTASNVEALGQQPFTLSSNLANLSSTAGARAGDILTKGMGQSISAQQAANSFNPWSTAIQGAASNPLTSLGLLNVAFG
jgi:hypothetical protein